MCEWLSTPGTANLDAGVDTLRNPAAIPLAVTGLSAAANPARRSGVSAVPLETPANNDVWFSRYLGSLVYGGLDGIITTFAIVSGVTGAHLAPQVVMILGLANLIGDGFSMATGAYLSSKSEHELYEREQQAAADRVNNNPHAVKDQLQGIYVEKGLSPVEAHGLVELLGRTPSRITAALLHETATRSPEENRPIYEGAFTFAAFGIAGAVPLLPYLLDALLQLNLSLEMRFQTSALMSAVTLFLLGSGKVRMTGKNLLRSGVEMLLVGGLAGAVAYGIGMLLRNLG